MNKRIRELALQANIHFSRLGMLDGDPDGIAKFVSYSKMEKFAELIIQECVDCLKPLSRNHSMVGAVRHRIRSRNISELKNEQTNERAISQFALESKYWL